MSEETSDARRWIVDATIMPKQGVNDPQGEAVFSGLRALGFDETKRVRCGKLIQLEVLAATANEAERQATAMCDRLLANPVIEEYRLSVRGDQDG